MHENNDMRAQAEADGVRPVAINMYDQIMNSIDPQRVRGGAIEFRDLNKLTLSDDQAEHSMMNGIANGVMVACNIFANHKEEQDELVTAAREVVAAIKLHQPAAVLLDLAPLTTLLHRIATREVDRVRDYMVERGEAMGLRRQLSAGTESFDDMLPEQFAMIGERIMQNTAGGAAKALGVLAHAGLNDYDAKIEVGKRAVRMHLQALALMEEAGRKHLAGDSDEFQRLITEIGL